jgi:hypothetical protein
VGRYCICHKNQRNDRRLRGRIPGIARGAKTKETTEDCEGCER